MSFYPVYTTQVGKRTARVYLQTRTSPYQPGDEAALEAYLGQVFEANKKVLDHGSKNVIIVWGDGNDTMADWWIWGETESESEGAGIEVYLFRNDKRYESPYVTAEDGLLVLASEAE